MRTDALGTAPHEVHVEGLVDELVDIRAFVKEHGDLDELVLERQDAQAAVSQFVINAAAEVSLVNVEHGDPA